MKDYYSVEEDLEEKMILLNEKDNIIKEVREYVEETHYYSDVINEEYLLKSELLKILNKESDNNG